jgi:hypothetical protein
MKESLLEKTVLFCRALRDRGLTVTPSEAIDSVATLDIIDLEDRQETFLSLRSVLTSRMEDFAVFEELFDDFWNHLGHHQPQKFIERKSQQHVRLSSTKRGEGLAFFLDHWGEGKSRAEEAMNMPVASDAPSRGEKDFSLFTSDEMEEIARLARRIARRLSFSRSRRWEAVPRGPKINLRRTIRRSLSTAGEPIELSFRRRKAEKTRLVVICDVSGSMDFYSRLLLQFVYSLQTGFARVETFVFSTSLERITPHLRQRTYEQALERLPDVRGWSGGTLIGQSLAAFNSDWSNLVDKRTVVIILSDGWDTGEPVDLAASLEAIKRRAGRLIWLNPLLGNADYQPLVRGMQAALPHIDVFAPLHNLDSLRALERLMVL